MFNYKKHGFLQMKISDGGYHFIVDNITWESLVASVHEFSVIIVPEFTPPSEGVALEHLSNLEHHEELIPEPWLEESVCWLGSGSRSHYFLVFNLKLI
jgi:hypothetical protein